MRERYIAAPLAKDVIEALLRACPPGRLGSRDKAAIVLLWRCGLRSREVTNLNIRDLEPHAGLVHVAPLKRSKGRSVGIGPIEVEVLHRWLYERRQIQGADWTPESPLLCSMRGRRLNPCQLRRALVKLAARAGVQGHVSPHRLRHSFATELARERTSIGVIQAALGHRSLASTEVYLARITPAELAELARGRPDWTEDK